MFKPTKNKYVFKYIQTGISGEGIKEVYLPVQPKAHEFVNNDDLGGAWASESTPAKWARKVPEKYKAWVADEKSNRNKNYSNENLNAYRKQEWDRRLNGAWFWNTVNGVRTPVYVTGLHYFYMQWWQTTFGYPLFLDTDKEFFYFWEYCCEDPCSYGAIFGTGRRGGKSAKMAVVQFEYCSRNFFANGGTQGENEKKLKEFFRMHVIYPFKKLPEFFRPNYDTSTQLKEEIVFTPTIKRGVKQVEDLDSEEESFEGKIDFGPTDVNHYNSAKLKRYLIEEGGKIKLVKVSKMYGAVKETLREFNTIIGKALLASTADEEDDVTEDFKKLCFDSDFDKKGKNGQTQSGLYFAFMPFKYLVEFDKFGIPTVERNEKFIADRRENVIEDPSEFALECRKMPNTLDEYFYVNPKNCQFDVMVLQSRNSALATKTNIASRMSARWKGEPFNSSVEFFPDTNGRFKVAWLPTDQEKNPIQDTGQKGPNRFIPTNELLFCAGTDPIDYKITEMMGTRRSMAAAFVKRRYSSIIDGEATQDAVQYKRDKKIPYQASRPVVMYHGRPDDPLVYYEDMLMMCVFFGIAILVEKQRGSGLITFFHQKGYARFIMKRPKSTYSADTTTTESDGIDANTLTIGRYTALIATDVYWFGHSYPFVELIGQLLKFNPSKTTESDLAVAWGWTLMAELKEVYEKPEPLALEDLFELVSYR